jgi:hypothetical protein
MNRIMDFYYRYINHSAQCDLPPAIINSTRDPGDIAHPSHLGPYLNIFPIDMNLIPICGSSHLDSALCQEAFNWIWIFLAQWFLRRVSNFFFCINACKSDFPYCDPSWHSFPEHDFDKLYSGVCLEASMWIGAVQLSGSWDFPHFNTIT